MRPTFEKMCQTWQQDHSNRPKLLEQCGYDCFWFSIRNIRNCRKKDPGKFHKSKKIKRKICDLTNHLASAIHLATADSRETSEKYVQFIRINQASHVSTEYLSDHAKEHYTFGAETVKETNELREYFNDSNPSKSQLTVSVKMLPTNRPIELQANEKTVC